MRAELGEHWPEYTIEAAALGCFMLSACVVGTLFEHPAVPVRQAIGDALPRRMLMGLTMGLTAVAIIYSPWGKRSGAHMNPSWTLTTLRLGRVAPRDAAFYAIAQFVGAVAGVQLASALLGARLADPAVHYVVTAPGPHGAAVAFGAEVAITAVLASVVLQCAASPRVTRTWTTCPSAKVAGATDPST